MIGKLIGWTFDFIARLWEGFWNVCGKLFGLAVFTVACGAASSAFIKIFGTASLDAWLYFKVGACGGFLFGGLRLLINEVAVPLVHAHEKRLRDERRREVDLQFARARALSNRETVSNRLKHLK
ncbi:MAG: hypothetical protein AAB554_02520 [Patescibacteria group bacterium]